MSACIDGEHRLGCQKIRTVHLAIPVEYRSHSLALRELLSIERNISTAAHSAVASLAHPRTEG